MMSTSSPTPHRRDDGFRVTDDRVDAAVSRVIAEAGEHRSPSMAAVWRVAAAIAVILGLGVVLSELTGPVPCESWACQFDALSDEELAGMIELIDEDVPLGLEEEWPTLY